MRRKLAVLALAVTFGSIAASPALAAKPSVPVDISLNQVTVSTVSGFTTVTMNVTNNSSVSVKIETNVEALLCGQATCDTDTTMNECVVEAIQGGTGDLAAFATADFTVIFDLGGGSYLFPVKVVGVKGGSEDRKQSVVGSIVP